MKLEDGRISILVGDKTTTIEITDKKAAKTFVSIELTSEQFCTALSRVQRVDCSVDVYDLDKVGKTHENKEFEFKLLDNMNRYDSDHKDIQAYAQSLLCERWRSDCYFGSQRSFFEKDGEKWARCTIRRWT